MPVFFDGIPTYVPYDGNLDLGRFMTSELESIEVSKGYTSLLQGPNLMGGAINLTTATPKKPFEANVSFSQGFARGADNAYNTSARVGARSDPGLSRSAAASTNSVSSACRAPMMTMPWLAATAAVRTPHPMINAAW